MGNSKLEKIYAVGVVLVLWVFLGSTMVYYFQKHDISKAGFINSDPNLLEAEETEIVKINWAELYPFAEEDNIKVADETPNDDPYANYPQLVKKYLSIVKDIKHRIDLYTRKKILARESLILAANSIKRDFSWPDDKIKPGATVMKMNNGYLTRMLGEPMTEEDLQEIVDSITDFADFRAKKKIGFIYANPGYKINPRDRQLSPFWDKRDFINENCDRLIKTLQDRKIDVINLREEMLNSKLDWYDSYYIGDHHWKTSTQLWAAGIIAEKLNKDYGFNYDLSYFDKNNYSSTLYKNIFLGSHGRAKADLNYLEDYELILPKFETKFEIDIPRKKLYLTGSYKETLIDLAQLSEILTYTGEDFLTKENAYGISRTSRVNENVTVLNGNRGDAHCNNKKILVLQDSFSDYLTGYLVLGTSRVDLLAPETFTGSIKAYVEKMQPDVVILICYARDIRPINWNKHTSAFDLR